MYSVKIEVPIRAAHRLLNYEGKCRNLHGEGYTIIVEFEAESVDNKGMLIDFGTAKKKIKSFLDEYVDHTTILSYKDFEAINSLSRFKNIKLCLLGRGNLISYERNVSNEVLSLIDLGTIETSPTLVLHNEEIRVAPSIEISSTTSLHDFLTSRFSQPLLKNVLKYHFPIEEGDLIKETNPTAENMAKIFYNIFYSGLGLSSIKRVGVVESYRDSIAYYSEEENHE